MLFQPTRPSRQILAHHKNAPSIDNENVKITQEQLSFEDRKEPQPTSIVNPPGT